MNGAALKTFFLGLIDEEDIDSTLFYQLLNVAKNRREAERDYMYLRTKDTSQTSSPGDSYTTMKDLPSDFRKMLRVFVGDTEHYGVGFEDQILYEDGAQKYYLDMANDQFAIIGQPASTETITQFYVKTTDDITSTTSPLFPSRFHPILAYDVAGYYTMGIDADNIYARMSPEHKMAAELLLDAMIKWDDDLALASQNYSATPFLHEGENRKDSINMYD